MIKEPIPGVHKYRDLELRAIFRFIDNAYDDEIASILSEINVCHGIQVRDNHTKQLKDVQCIEIGGTKIRLIVDELTKE